ncbi:MAG: dihydrofolate reductase, partial [Phyllobacterium sp.]
KVSGTGVTINKYVRGGQVMTGSFEFEQPTEAELERRKNLS